MASADGTGGGYSTRVLDEELALDTPEVVTVLAIRTDVTSSWQEP